MNASSDPIRFGIVGGGWRAEFFCRVASACPNQLQIVGIVGSSSGRIPALAERYGLTRFDSTAEMVSRVRPRFVVTAVPRATNPEIILDLVKAQVPVLSETPPAGTVDDLRELWASVGGAPVLVAEQYRFQPHHAARLALARSGRLGRISQAQVSAAHGYHGVSLVRAFLGIQFEEATITARRFDSPIVKGPGRGGPPEHEAIAQSTQEIAWLDFGDRLGIYDFTGDQYFSWFRAQRLLVRGDRGEIIDLEATYLKDFKTPLKVEIHRHQAGVNGNLEGNYLRGLQAGDEWLYVNLLAPASLSDDEIAVGSCLLEMDCFVSSGSGGYSLAEASQDTYLALSIADAVNTGERIRTSRMPWSGAD